MKKALLLPVLLAVGIRTSAAQSVPLPAQDSGDKAPPTQMVPVEKEVTLNVVDWGGSGRPLILLTGLGDDSHIFDRFAPKLTVHYHVYGITRRGRGDSSKPKPEDANYSPSRLGEDVLAVVRALHIQKPVIAGHSISGEELSYIGSQHPGEVAGLIYMEAAYPYALYDEKDGNLGLDANALRKELLQFSDGLDYDPVKDYKGLLADLQRVEMEVKQRETETKGLPLTPESLRMTPDLFAIMRTRERFAIIHVPALVMFGVAPFPVTDPQTRAQERRQRLMMRDKNLQIAAVRRQMLSAQVVLIPGASHYIFQSDEPQVLNAINAFIAALP